MITKVKTKTLSIDLALVSIQEMVGLLMEYEGYIDGDRRTLELYVCKRK